ncbi:MULTISPECIES: ABC transporter substrate-binding protein [Protofrankia]|uniref:ABC-type transporter, periplasmic subunit n=1 Tax=Candidatus Protofrankia datiscae TaxID=2716812 RepID=F8B5L3_9ACTN|nr:MULTISPECIES: ABC transporter substrate-binding protein [Protofrankia]AEH09183.1 ABC-type transporter, periplasmic subunit [Candidatus Protofrankia datiscae]
MAVSWRRRSGEDTDRNISGSADGNSAGRRGPRWRAATVSLLTVAFLAACGGGDGGSGTNADNAQPVPGGRLKIAFWADFQGCIDPNQVYWIESRSIDRNFADSLTDQDPRTGEIVPWLATSWTASPDAREYTFTLRKGVTFSDGTPLDASAVKTALDGVRGLGAKSTLGVTYLAGYESSTVVDPQTVKVNFSAPNAAFLQATSTTTLAILSPATYKETAEARCAGKVIGSGQFVLDSYNVTKAIKLSRRAGYAWPSALVKNQGDAYLDGIDVSYIAEDSVRVGSLTTGTIDVAWPRLPITSADQEVIKAANGVIETRSLPGISAQIVPNVNRGGPLADLKVRQALYKAIDLKSYASTVYWDGYPVVKGPYDSTTPYAADLSAKLAHDPAGAAALLDSAGWAKGSDGYRYKDGRKLTLTYLIISSTPGEQLLQDQLKKSGVDLQLKVLTNAQYTQLTTAGEFDLAGSYLTRGDPSVLGSTLDRAVSKNYATVYSQDDATAAEVSRLFARGLNTIDPARRAAAYKDLQDYLIDHGVVFPTYDRVQVVGLSNKVHGFAWTSESFLRANDIWLSK